MLTGAIASMWHDLVMTPADGRYIIIYKDKFI